MWYGRFLENMGRLEENLAMRRRAIVIDPLNPAAEVGLGSALSHAGRLDEAIRQLEGVLDSNRRSGRHIGTWARPTLPPAVGTTRFARSKPSAETVP
jgi:tetratricopeptide (TPR) repeat protein